MKIDTLIFDLDNTIVDTSQLKVHRDARDWRKCEELVSSHTRLIIDPSKLPANLKIGIVTNSPRNYAESILKHYKFPYDSLIAYHDCTPRKPDKAPMLKCLEQLNSSHLNALCIGDNTIDIEAGNSAQIVTIGVSWGDCSKELLQSSNVDHLAEDETKLYDIIRKRVNSEFYPLFVNQNDNKKNTYFLDKYYPYSSTDKDVFRGSNSGRILDVKEGKIDAINYYFDKINPKLNQNITICIVPSSDSEKTNSGIRKLADKLISNNRLDACHCLKRVSTIDKLAHGGSRDIQIHLDSISVIDNHLIDGKDILLLDDIFTTRNSFLACESLLLQAGANRVVCLALGKTTHQELNVL